MAIDALVSITLEVGIKCLIVETWSNQGFLKDTNEITFSDEDMEVRDLDHRRLLYLVASINQIPIKRVLMDIGISVNIIPLNTLQSARIHENKILGHPMEVIGFEGRGKYTAVHIQLWPKVGPIASLTRFHVVKTKVLYHVLLG